MKSGENVKQEAADKRATEAEVRKTKERAVRNANRAIAKLTPLQLSLSTSLSSKYIKHVAEFATNMAKESHVAVQMVLAAAKKMVQARSGPVEFKYEADELSQVRVHLSILHTTPHPRTSNFVYPQCGHTTPHPRTSNCFIPPVWCMYIRVALQVATDAVNSDKLLKGLLDTASKFACKRVDAQGS